MSDNNSSNELLALTTEIVSSHVANNSVSLIDLPQLIQNVYATLAGIGGASAAAGQRPQPAVPIKSPLKSGSVRSWFWHRFGSGQLARNCRRTVGPYLVRSPDAEIT